MANMAFINLKDPVYSDGIWQLRRSKSGEPLASPRAIGNKMKGLRLNVSDSKRILNVFGLMYGQFIVHDISDKLSSSNKDSTGFPVSACTQDYSMALNESDTNPFCFAVGVPRDDPLHKNFNVSCFTFVRMAAAFDNCGKIKFGQWNSQSSTLDHAPIYSLNKTTADSMREFKGGRFKLLNGVFPALNGRFITGDRRSGQTSMLALIHYIYYILHNIICDELRKINPHWTDEKLFQESRRINIAIHQQAIYEEWLPAYIGEEACDKFKLRSNGKYTRYDKGIHLGTSSEFSHGAMRVLHQNIPAYINFANADWEIYNKTRLADTFLKAQSLNSSEYRNGLFYGNMLQGLRFGLVGLTQQMRDNFLKKPFRGGMLGGDVEATDIGRNRDSGLAPFYKYTETPITCWDDLEQCIDPICVKPLKEMYNVVEDVDLITGLNCERRPKGHPVGQTAAKIIAEQFKRLKDGDKFFYEHHENPHRFTREQLDELKKMTLSMILYLVFKAEKMPKHALYAPSSDEDFMECAKYPPFNFGLFREPAEFQKESQVPQEEYSQSEMDSLVPKCPENKPKESQNTENGGILGLVSNALGAIL